MLKNSREERRWILNDWANSAYSVAITTAILPIYFKEVAARDLSPHLSTAYWGYANSLSAALVAVLAPWLGTLSDFRGFKMPLFAGFTLLGALSTGALALVGPGDWLACLSWYFLSAVGFAGMSVAYDAFLMDVTVPARRDWVSSQGFAYGYIGSCIPFVLSILLIRHPEWAGLPSAQAATRVSFVITALWWLGFSLPMLRGVRQIRGLDPTPHPVLDSLRRMAATLRDARSHRPAFIFLVAYFFYIDGVQTLLKMSGVLGKDFGLSTSVLMMIFLYVQIVAFPFALLWGKVASRFGQRPLLLGGIAIYVTAIVLCSLAKTEREFWIVATLAASAQGGMQALSRSAFAELIPPNRAGEFFGFYNILGRFAAVLGPLLMGLTAHFTGSSRLSLLALLPLFALGAWFLRRAPRPATPL